MAGFTKEQHTELKELFRQELDHHRSVVMVEMKGLLRQELTEIRERLDQLFGMESEDIQFLHAEIQSLKKRLTILEKRTALSRKK